MSVETDAAHFEGILVCLVEYRKQAMYIAIGISAGICSEARAMPRQIKVLILGK